MKYTISDIHGMFDKFLQLLEKINFSDTDELYIIGDVIDRGPKPVETIEYIMGKPNMHLLMGNHEHMMLTWNNAYLQRRTEPYELLEAKRVWMLNGGKVTLKQFQKLSLENKIRIIRFLIRCPYYVIIDKFILVHSGIRVDAKFKDTSVEEIMKQQSVEDLLESRGIFYNNKAIEAYTIIFGHTPTEFICKDRKENCLSPLNIWHDRTFKDKIGIDCGACFEKDGGMLACLRLDDMQEFYV